MKIEAFELVSDENDRPDNKQKIVIKHRRFGLPEDDDEDFEISIGSELEFAQQKQTYIQLTVDEARTLYSYLGRYFDTLPTQDVVGMLRKAADEIEKSAKPFEL